MRYLDNRYYHLYNRGSRAKEIFFEDKNYTYFLRLLSVNTEKHAVQIAAYCLMPNHYHLIVKQEAGGKISKLIQSTIISYVQAVNKQFHFSGSLFQGKAKAKIIDSDEYAIQVVRYIHFNPVRANLVEKPEQWKYSDFSRWIGKLDVISGILGNRTGCFVDAVDYLAYVESYREESNSNMINKYLF